ncbi:MAG TPA: NAD-dependent succinate-semialdehyde dehydrogenase [Nitrososphaeraceae archaeon]|jgi:succinate-semialdehyde dehydrogenase/glutarate-semialdehyde dehydrogenase/succinyl-CoA reductase|nr:NAD-dependent succinate-semialdehyde dehydrogenase [Nitrososphaeraceae archaeon]
MDNTVVTVNPANDRVIHEYENMTREQVTKIVDKSRTAFREWKDDVRKRSMILLRLAEQLRKNKESLARIASEEMGKPIKESRSEIEKCAWAVEFYSYNGDILLNNESLNSDANKTMITFQPLGVIGSIMPWNFPYWQALRFAAPSLMAGNTIVLKPASATMQCGVEIEKTISKSGAADGVFSTIIGNSKIAEMLIDSNIDGVTFTGSIEIGAKVAQRATSRLKKCVLELGGSDPFIVLDDADIEKASSGAIKGRFLNCGQSCVASKRFIVSKKIANEFIESFVQKAEKLNVGDPMSDSTDIGPLSSMKSLDNIDSMVKDAVSLGGELLTGGQRIGSVGAFYKPTVIKNVNSQMRVSREETFGPVAPIMVVEDESEAIQVANNSDFGLGGSIWTRDLNKAQKLSSELECGIVTVNNMVASDPRVPFGGIKHSGFGRELSRYGMLEFVNVKSVRFYDKLVYEHHVE